MLIWQPANVATPAVAPSGLVVQVNVPLPGLLLMASVTLAVLSTGFPLASSNVTAGCAVHAVPALPPPGCVVNTNCVAVAAVTLKPLLVALVKPLLVAVRV